MPNKKAKDRTVHKSSCCDADLIYYDIEEDSFYGNEGDLLITKKGIDKIESVLKENWTRNGTEKVEQVSSIKNG